MQVGYKDGAIVAQGQLHEKAEYDVSNNRITAQFDGRGAISKYAVMNKYSVFSNFYAIITLDGKPLDYMCDKRVVMLGKKQVTYIHKGGAGITLTQFLDTDNNCIYVEYAILSDRDIDFKCVNNFGINYESYVTQLPTNRLSAGNLLRIVGGLMRKKKVTCETRGDVKKYCSEVMGDFYLDVAIGCGGEIGECERGFFNQFSLGGKVSAGVRAVFRYVISAGTKGDFTYCDVLKAFYNFDKAVAAANNYALSLKCPVKLEGDFLNAYYKSLLNCSLSNYKELGKFKGFLAGIVYQFPARTYYRDAYWTVLSVLPVRPDLVRNEIVTLARGIDGKGECPSAVKFNFKNYWGNHYDSPSFYVIMLYDYVAHTGDMSVLDVKCAGGTCLSAAHKVMRRLLKEADSTGMIVKGGKYNRRDWCDNVFRGGYVTYDEALYARALYAMSELYRAKGESELSRDYLSKYIKVKESINRLLWDEDKGWYVNYKDGDFTEDNLSIDTVVCALYDIADEERAKRMLSAMERLLETKNNSEQGAGDWGTMCVYPFYKNAEHIVQKSSLPYYYHNGGDWPYLSCMYAYAKLMYGMDYMYPLTRWFEYNIRQGNYTPIEFFSPVHPKGSLLQAWSSTGAFVLSYPGGDFFRKTIV